MRRIYNFTTTIILAGFMLGCSSSPQVIPESLEPKIDKDLVVEQIMKAPDSYQGKIIVIGGRVLQAKRLHDGTQVEILQLPLDGSQQPITQLTESKGRFLALQKEFLDPAKLPKGTNVTIVGEVTGSSTERLDEAEYQYLTLNVQHLHVWVPRAYNDSGPSPRFGIFGGGSSGGRVGGGVGIGIGF